MRRSLKMALWLSLYFLLIFAPLIILLITPRAPGREFWREFSVALGFFGMALMGSQAIPTARLSFLADVFPMDNVFFVHHRLGIAGFVMALIHPLVLFVNNPYTIRLLNFFTAPNRARAGLVALVGAAALVITSVYRQQIRIKYESWHLSHALLAIGAIVLAFVHIFGVNYHTAMPAQRLLWIVLAVLWGVAILYLRVIDPLIELRYPYTIAAVTEVPGRSWHVRLVPDGHPGLRFTAGQFAWLTVGHSPFTIHENPFSFSSSAENTEYIEFTIRELGDWTARVKEIPVGSRAYIDGPYGTFSTDHYPAPGYVFLGGGVGITPLMSMLRTMADREDRTPVLLMYGNQKWEWVLFREELAALEKQINLRLVHVLEQPHAGWEGESGFITADMLDRYLPANREELVYLICGPVPMLNAMDRALQKLRIPPSQVLAERYDIA